MGITFSFIDKLYQSILDLKKNNLIKFLNKLKIDLLKIKL